jgi:hypothetical protein
MGIRYLNHAAVIKCVHGGLVQLIPPPWPSYYIEEFPILTDRDLLQAMIIECPQIGPALKPCTRIVRIMIGRALQIDVDGETPILMTLNALTDGVPAGICLAFTDGNSNDETIGILSVTDLTLERRLALVVDWALNILPVSIANELRALISPRSLAMLLAVLALSHVTGEAELIEAGLLLFFGTAVVRDLLDAIITTRYARTEAELDEAAGHLAHAISTGGVGVFVGALVRFARGKRAEPTRDPSEEARAAARMKADEAQQIKGSDRPGTAASLVTKTGEVYRETSLKGQDANLHPKVIKVLDSVPENERRPYHEKCAEPQVVSKALTRAEQGEASSPRGGRLATALIRRVGHPDHGTPIEPCPSCKVLLKAFDIKWVDEGNAPSGVTGGSQSGPMEE